MAQFGKTLSARLRLLDGQRTSLEEPDDPLRIYLHAAVITDQALLPESVHEFTYSWAGGTNHLRQGRLAHLQGRVRLRFPRYLPEQQQHTRQPPFAEIEKLIYQVFLDSDNPRK
jgi:hypothetical protein